MLPMLTDRRIIDPILIRHGTKKLDMPLSIRFFFAKAPGVTEHQVRIDSGVRRIDVASLDRLVEEVNELFVGERSESIHEITPCHPLIVD